MTNTTQPAPEPDMIAQAGELLRLFQLGMPLSDGTHGQDDATIVTASVALAIAGELRELRNLLAMAMSEGSDANGSPISALRIDRGA